MSTAAVWLLSGLLVAHCLGDYTPLATDRMQLAKANGGPLGLIAGHAAVHGVLVAVAIATLATAAWSVIAIGAAIEFVTHFLIDAVRAQLSHRFQGFRDPARRTFWTALGVDQLAHALVLVGLAAYVL